MSTTRHTMNWLFTVLLALAVIVASIAVLIVAVGWFSPGQVAVTPWMRDQLQLFTNLSGDAWARTVSISGALIFVGLIVLIIDLIPGPRQPSQLIVSQDGLGVVRIRRDSVTDLVNWEAATIPGVRETESHTDEDAGSLLIRCRVSLGPDANATEVAETLQARIKAAVEHHVGRAVSQVAVDTQLAPLSNHRSRPRVR